MRSAFCVTYQCAVKATFEKLDKVQFEISVKQGLQWIVVDQYKIQLWKVKNNDR